MDMDVLKKMCDILDRNKAIINLMSKGFEYNDGTYFYAKNPSLFIDKIKINTVILCNIENKDKKSKIYSHLLTYKEWFSHMNCDTNEVEFLFLFKKLMSKNSQKHKN